MYRIIVFFILFLVTASPLIPLFAPLFHAESLLFTESDRLLILAANTFELAIGACLVAVPLGTAMAVALSRLPIPSKESARLLIIVGLFIPLPVTAAAWQIIIGTWLAPDSIEWRPWKQGLPAAVFVHGVAAIPWVIWIVSNGLRHADTAVEEDAIMTGGFRTWLRRAILPRAMLAAAAAIGWTVLQCVTEIVVTDTMLVRTFAEEVLTEFVSQSNGLAAAAATALPAWLYFILLGGSLARRVVRNFDTPPTEIGRPPTLVVNRVLIGILFWVMIALFTLFPLAALVWKAGMGGTSGGFAFTPLEKNLRDAVKVDGGVMAGSVGTAIATGLIAALLAWFACHAAQGSRSLTRLLFVWCIVCAVAPAPVVGFGLKKSIAALVDVEEKTCKRLGITPEFPPLKSALYDQPSPIPAIWATIVRFFPLACAILWPVFRSIPPSLLEETKLDGLGTFGAIRRVIFPLTELAFLSAAAAVAALALGEVGASKLVNPPGRSSFIQTLFQLMHYGADTTVAAYSLLQIAVTIVGVVIVRMFLPTRWREST